MIKDNLITIVTVSYNAGQSIEKTILSVVNQTYNNTEYIIIDGNSTDETVNIIKKHEDKITYWISEPDQGIYHAMNKAIDRATGDWIIFMNAGDIFANNNILVDVFMKNSLQIKEADVIYGDTVYDYYSYSFMLEPDKLETLKIDKNFCHQSSFVRTNLMKKDKFNQDLKICSDFQFFYNLYQNEHNFLYLPIVISLFWAEESFSQTNRILAFKERAEINQENKSILWPIKLLKFAIRRSLGAIYKSFISKENLVKKRISRLSDNERVRWIKFK